MGFHRVGYIGEVARPHSEAWHVESAGAFSEQIGVTKGTHCVNGAERTVSALSSKAEALEVRQRLKRAGV